MSNKKMYVQIVLDPLIETDKKVIDHLSERYSHLKPGQVYKELMRRDMEEKRK
jgi:hypothetical protein